MTESCGSKNRTGRSLPQRRPATNVALGPAGFDPQKQSLIHYLPSKAGRTSGRYRNFRRASGVLRASRGERFGPRGSASRRNSTNKSAQTTTKGSAQFCRVRAARSPGGPKAQRAGPATLKDRNSFTHPTARLSPHSVMFGLSPTPPKHSQQINPKPVPILSLYSVKFVLGAGGGAASGECNELQRVAALPLPGRRTARPKGSQKHGQQLSPTHSPVLRPVSASLRLRCRSAAFSRVCAIQRFRRKPK